MSFDEVLDLKKILINFQPNDRLFSDFPSTSHSPPLFVFLFRIFPLPESKTVMCSIEFHGSRFENSGKAIIFLLVEGSRTRSK